MLMVIDLRANGSMASTGVSTYLAVPVFVLLVYGAFLMTAHCPGLSSRLRGQNVTHHVFING